MCTGTLDRQGGALQDVTLPSCDDAAAFVAHFVQYVPFVHRCASNHTSYTSVAMSSHGWDVTMRLRSLLAVFSVRHRTGCSRLHVVCVHGCAMMSQRPLALKKTRAAHWNESMPTCSHVFSPSIACASNDVCVVVCVRSSTVSEHACTCVHMRAHACTCTR
mgnify:CR=1 FL=1